ncbi:MAG: 30S ribosomal protein S5 [Vampirovibrionales bacterium]|nr:30S ribosomal protein S5 [Vampirovibrionales bacterium]
MANPDRNNPLATPGGDADGERSKRRGSRGRREDRNLPAAEPSEWQEKVIQIRRVTKVVKGGKKMSFRAVVIVGNGKGQVGMGIGKSAEVIGAIQKGVAEAKRNLITVALHCGTVVHRAEAFATGTTVRVLPAVEGTGVIAGGAVRTVLELAGVHNVLAKKIGSNNPLNMARATLRALEGLRSFKTIAKNRGLSVKAMLEAS